MIAWACGTVRFHPGEALGAIQGAVCKRLINARPFEITALLWAFVALGEEPMDLLDAIAADPEVIEVRACGPKAVAADHQGGCFATGG